VILCIFKKKKKTFLTIQLSPQFDFGHRTSKPGIFGHPTINTDQIWPMGRFDG
jgi:hypothetical protein